MASEDLARMLVRAACFLVAALFILWPLVANGRFGVGSLALAAPFILAGLAPRLLGPWIGQGLIFIATLVAFYDAPSSITFSLERFAMALPIFALALILTLPALSQTLARRVLRE